MNLCPQWHCLKAWVCFYQNRKRKSNFVVYLTMLIIVNSDRIDLMYHVISLSCCPGTADV